MLCNVCKVDVHPYVQYSAQRGMLHKCPRCDGGLSPTPLTVVSVDADDRPITFTEQRDGDVDHAAEDVVAVDVPRSVVHAKATPPAQPIDVLAMAKARLATVNELIDQLRAYEAEQALLVRMIEAAEPTARTSTVLPFAKQG